MKHITIIAYEQVLATSISLPTEILNAAETIRKIRDRKIPDSHSERLNVNIASVAAKPIPTTGGIVIQPSHRILEIQHTDLVIIPAMWGNPRPVVRRYPDICQWIRQQHQQDAIICSVGTGAFLLAATGLLDNKVATTHWYYFDLFEKTYPQIRLQKKRFLTNAGNVYCAGSVNSVTDLMIHFIENIYSNEIAQQVSRHFSHEIKRSYETGHGIFDEQNTHHDETIVKAQEWMRTNYSNSIQLKDIARQLGMSLRTLNRRFKLATNESPLQYLQQIRVDTAKDLLKNSNLSIAEISYHVGYSDLGHFASLFKKMISMSPSQYRRMVRAKLFSVN